MAEVQQQESNRRDRKRKAYPILRVDMTPMVDLAFLLLTFFVLTSELKKETVITTRFPADGPHSLVKDPITVLVGKDSKKFFWYRGKFDASVHLNAVGPDKNGLFNVLSHENGFVYNQIQVINRQHNLGLLNDKSWSAKRASLQEMSSIPFVIVKWGAETNYASVVDALDDLNRSDNSKYAVVPISKDEQNVLDEQK